MGDGWGLRLLINKWSDIWTRYCRLKVLFIANQSMCGLQIKDSPRAVSTCRLKVSSEVARLKLSSAVSKLKTVQFSDQVQAL